MKKIFTTIVIFTILTFCTFAKATTDIEVGGLFGYGSYKRNEKISGYNVNENIILSGGGFDLGCDVEITNKIGLFLILDVVFPSKAELNYELNGKSYSYSDDNLFKVNFFIDELFGPEYVHYFTENFKLRIGGGFCFAGIVSSSEKMKTVEIDYMFGLGTKIDATYQLTNVVGLQLGCNVKYYFIGSYETTKVTAKGDITNKDSLSEFSLVTVAPSLGVVFHIGGSH